MSTPRFGAQAVAEPVAASVIIPAYQAEAFVADAITSALSQTLTDLEVIVVDDGSTDRTWEIVLACAREDPRVVPVRTAARSGPSAARNTGIRLARGRWLAVLDADDLFHPDRLVRMIATAEAVSADLLADNLLKVDFSSGEEVGERFSRESMGLKCPVRLADALRRDMPGRSATGELFGFFQPIIRRGFLVEHGIRYDEEILVGEDFLLYIECIVRGGRFHLVPEAWYIQRLRPRSHSARRDAMLHLSAVNRRIAGITAGLADGEAAALQRCRQRQIDIDCFSLMLERGQIRAAMRHAHLGSPAQLLRHARAACGAIRLRLAGRAAGGATARCNEDDEQPPAPQVPGSAQRSVEPSWGERGFASKGSEFAAPSDGLRTDGVPSGRGA